MIYLVGDFLKDFNVWVFWFCFFFVVVILNLNWIVFLLYNNLIN